MKALEAYRGTRLDESPGGRVRLTPAGERVQEMAMGLFDRVRQFAADLAAEGGAGWLTVAAEETSTCRPTCGGSWAYSRSRYWHEQGAYRRSRLARLARNFFVP